MTDDQHITHGIGLEPLDGFAQHAADSPDAVQFGLGAAATYEETAAHSLAPIDAPAEVASD